MGACPDCEAWLTESGVDMRTCVPHGSKHFSLICKDDETMAVFVAAYRQEKPLLKTVVLG